MIPQIIIVISGGVLQNVISNEPIDYCLIDHDNITAGDEYPDYVTDFVAQDVLMTDIEMCEYMTSLKIDQILEEDESK